MNYDKTWENNIEILRKTGNLLVKQGEIYQEAAELLALQKDNFDMINIFGAANPWLQMPNPMQMFLPKAEND